MADRPHTLSVPEAGRIYFEMGRRASYAAAARGEIPVIRIGKFLRVPVKALEQMLEQPKSTEAILPARHPRPSAPL
jgi:hypothetical protein